MKTFLKIILALMILGHFQACKTYQPLGNKVTETQQSLSEQEKLELQLDQVKEHETIKVLLQNGKEYELEYLSHSREVLYANLIQTVSEKKQKTAKTPFEIPLDQLETFKVLRTNYLISIGIPASILMGFIIYMSTVDLSMGPIL
ncbi:hypothetical protein E4S40_02165 [Algoriphagus kandeliae]|uniref:Uncharacterized protein n=1 Tax=Algoriphagus kandeliae TaxID=2562278 RepID=A0A4Y9R0V6_9BACT|nr:hypothetical protein [Algoriphagus kandeliae]TFV97482.1 hypothetical protein E4S40_02165 [Algoriphagus kandeliae]